jgi:hypothetical protein
LALRDREWLLNDGQIQNPSAQSYIAARSQMVWRGFGFVHHSRTLFCRAVPNPYHTIRNFFIAVPPCMRSSRFLRWLARPCQKSAKSGRLLTAHTRPHDRARQNPNAEGKSRVRCYGASRRAVQHAPVTKCRIERILRSEARRPSCSRMGVCAAMIDAAALL